MSITITNPEGRNVEFKDQRGPTCGLYALSFVLEYLYDIKIPATADGDKTRESLRTGGIQGGLQKRVIRQAHLQQMIPGLNHQAVFIPKIGPQCNACSLHQQKTSWPFRKRRTATMPKKL